MNDWTRSITYILKCISDNLKIHVSVIFKMNYKKVKNDHMQGVTYEFYFKL